MAMNRKSKITVTVVSVATLFTVVSLWAVHAKNRQKEAEAIREAFEDFRAVFETGDNQKAYELMSPRYKKNHTVEEFTDSFTEIVPLEADWCVVEDSEGKITLCCTHPGASFAPSSTMTYVFEKVNGTWYFSGESAMWLD